MRNQMGRTIAEFNMIQDGDRLMVCISGGKAPHVLLDLLLIVQRIAQIHFELLAINARLRKRLMSACPRC